MHRPKVKTSNYNDTCRTFYFRKSILAMKLLTMEESFRVGVMGLRGYSLNSKFFPGDIMELLSSSLDQSLRAILRPYEVGASPTHSKRSSPLNGVLYVDTNILRCNCQNTPAHTSVIFFTLCPCPKRPE